MKEFILTQSYATIEDMLNSGEVAVYIEELQQCNIDFYAIVSRIGNRYNIRGEKIIGYEQNPYSLVNAQEVTTEVEVVVENETTEIVKEKKEEETDMKYVEIEALINAEIENAVAEIKTVHEQEIATLKEQHTVELENAKAEAKAELIAKLNG